MSWTDIYPLLTNEMLDAYQAQATPGDLEKLDGWLAVDRVLNPKKSSHLVVASLYWDPRLAGGEFPGAAGGSLLRESLLTSWEGLRRLLEGASAIESQRQGVVLRVYLSADLVGIADLLIDAGCEVVLMRGRSSSKNPASLWRFLALEEEGRWITVTHANFGSDMIHDVERTEQVMATELGCWRVPYLVGDPSQRLEARSYRPIHSAHFGSKGGLPAGLLMRALIWHGLQGSIPLGCLEGDGTRSYPLEGSEWGSDSFDQWFLLAAVYPRLAFEGVLTFLIWQRKSVNYWYAVDVEYVTWANPASEVFFTRKIVASATPWSNLPESNGVTVRADASVFRRLRRKIYEGSDAPLPRDEILPFTPFDGDLAGLLEWSSENVATNWWIDLAPSLRSFPTGSELFLDRRFDTVDVVVCGFHFVRITGRIAAWAAEQGLEGAAWKEGEILKVPKLEGPLTLWRTGFSRVFQEALGRLPSGIPAELLLEAWRRQEKAAVKNTTATRMGWRLN